VFRFGAFRVLASEDPKTGKPAPALLDARVARTRAALRNALMALLEEKPFAEITIRDITGKANAGYATFFRHYETKNALLHDLASDEVAAMISLSTNDSVVHDTIAITRAICAYVQKRKTVWTALLTGGAAGMLREEFARQGRQVAVARSSMTWLPIELSVLFTIAGTVEVLAWWLRSGDQYDAEAVAEILNRLVFTNMVHNK
jgi:AcrR family transcriptional regulator